MCDLWCTIGYLFHEVAYIRHSLRESRSVIVIKRIRDYLLHSLRVNSIRGYKT